MSMTRMKEAPKELTPLIGRVIGFVDTEADLQAILQALEAAGFAKTTVAVFQGAHGIRCLEQLRTEISSDDEKDVIDSCLEELRSGHIGIELEVENQDQARLIAETAAQFHARHFTYFGPWSTMFVS